MKLTMTAIARLAKVSQTTVSLIVNGKADGRISPKTQQQVLEIIKAHNFKPDQPSRNQKQPKNNAVGLLMPTPRSSFMAALLTQIQNKIRAKHFLPVMAFWDRPEQCQEAFESVFQQEIRGVIAWEYNNLIEKKHIPAVLFCRRFENTDSILIDYNNAIGQAINHLTGLGHRKIGYIGCRQDDRYTAFLQKTSEMQLNICQDWIQDISRPAPEQGCNAMEKLLALPLENRPSALIISNDSLARGACYAARQHRLNLPKDLSIISFGDDADSAYMLPRLSTFALPAEIIAENLVERIIVRMQNPRNPELTLSITPRLVLRQSCAAPRKQ